MWPRPRPRAARSGRALTERFKYIAGRVRPPGHLQPAASQHLDEADRLDGTGGNRLYYLATIPSVFGLVAEALAKHACTKPAGDGTFARMVVEKPYGRDLDSAIALDEQMHAAFDESQIYRIDHYMGKETVQNVLALRFANAIFEPIWNRRYIVHRSRSPWPRASGSSTAAASTRRPARCGTSSRTMSCRCWPSPSWSPPPVPTPIGIRDEKVKLLRAIEIPTPDEAVDRAVRGQYTAGIIDGEKVLGYRQEQDVVPRQPDRDVPGPAAERGQLALGGGPHLRPHGQAPAGPGHRGGVAAFRQVPHLLFDKRTSRDLRPNALILRIQPDEGISLEFGAKVPGEKFHLRSVAMDFSYAEAFAGMEAADGYERLIHDAMVGDATLFIRTDEVEQAWRIVDPYLEAWSEPGGAHASSTRPGTWGPHMADLLVERSGDEWRNPAIDLELSGGRLTELPQ